MELTLENINDTIKYLKELRTKAIVRRQKDHQVKLTRALDVIKKLAGK